MDNALKIVLLAVAAIIVAVLVVAAFSLVNSGQSLLSTGKSQINSSLSDYAEVAYTQYDGAVVAGSQVASAIKNEWKSDNTVAIGVMTQDGQNVWYDYSGQQAELLKDSKTAEQGGKAKGIDLNSLPDQNAQGESLASANTFSSSEDGWTAVVSKAATKGDDAVDVGNGAQLTAGASGETSGDLKSTSLTSSTTGYNSGASASTAGYINPRKNFKGSIQRDTNGNIRSVVFVQQAN